MNIQDQLAQIQQAANAQNAGFNNGSSPISPFDINQYAAYTYKLNPYITVPTYSESAAQAKALGVKFNISPIYLRFHRMEKTVIINQHRGSLYHIFHMCAFEHLVGSIVVSSESNDTLATGIPDDFEHKCDCDTVIDKPNIIAAFMKYSADQLKNV